MQTLMILGGGFGGVWAAMSAAAERDRRNAENLRIELVTKDRSLTIRPRLYEGAKDELLVPLAPLMAAIDVEMSIAEAQEIDLASATIKTVDDRLLHFERLVLASGSQLRSPRSQV